jgi:hypothetical protein
VEIAVVLPAGDYKLVLSRDSNDWTTVKLTKGESVYLLGADLWEKLSARFATVLQPGSVNENAGVINGRDVRYVSSFFENHHTLYAVNEESSLIFYLQDAQGNVYTSFVLSPEEQKVWLEKLI